MTRPALTRLMSLALALSLSLGTGPAQAAPAERDLAYELGIQAEADGDPGRAAAAFERAYRLTAPAETGPRLLFLRASVTARLRAAGPGPAGDPLARVSLCQARALLHDYLDPLTAPATGAPDPAADERSRLAEVEQRLSAGTGPDCATLLAPVATPTPVPPPGPATTPATTPPQTTPPPAPRPAPPAERSGRRERIAGGVALGVGVTGLALLITGVVIGRRANARGHALCREAMTGCTAFGSQLRDIEVLGRRGDILLGVGAVVGGLGLVSGAVLLAIGLRRRGTSRVSWTPQVTPSSAGLTLSGRF